MIVLNSFTTDARYSERRKRREEAYFQYVRRAELGYAVQLRKVARHVADLIFNYDALEPQELSELQNVLSLYADTLRPWARAAARRMLAEVIRRDEQAWRNTSRKIGISLQTEIQSAPIGNVASQILDDQVSLITSLPIDAGRRVQELALEHYVEGRRSSEIIPMIMESGNVTLSRATMIARTETGKAASAITQARAKFIGAEQYIWRTARDVFVRKAHKKLEGKVFNWDDPPVAEENGTRHNPGEFPNCRCFAEPLIPEVIE
jgi:SPP1 gp7 family putative phage head morphogenesis protein